MMMRHQQQGMRQQQQHVKVRKPYGREVMNDWQMMMAAPQPPPMCAAPIVGFPRSAFEAVHDESTKFRQLPCRTHISVGVCPYREKCVFLHDPRCCSATAKSITRLKNKNKDDCVADSLYWPAMPRSMVMQYPEHGNGADKNRMKNPYQQYDDHDSDQQPHTVQPYCVPVPQQDQYHLHDAAVYSMWMHFVDFCLANASPCHHPDTAMCYAAVDVAVNPYARSKRLPVFRALCNGQHVSAPAPRYHAAAAPPAMISAAPMPMMRDARESEYLHSLRAPSPVVQPTANSLDPFAPAVFAPSKPLAPIGASSAPAPVSAPVPAGLLSGIASVGSSPLAPSPMPASPAVLVRRNSTSSPVSIINTSTLEFDELLTDEEGSEEVEELIGADTCGVSSLRLQRQNLSQTLVAPMF